MAQLSDFEYFYAEDVGGVTQKPIAPITCDETNSVMMPNGFPKLTAIGNRNIAKDNLTLRRKDLTWYITNPEPFTATSEPKMVRATNPEGVEGWYSVPTVLSWLANYDPSKDQVINNIKGVISWGISTGTTQPNTPTTSYDTALTFPDSDFDNEARISGKVAAPDVNKVFQFNAETVFNETEYAGKYNSMTIKLNGNVNIVIDFLKEYLGKYFKYQYAAGKFHEGVFTNDDVLIVDNTTGGNGGSTGELNAVVVMEDDFIRSEGPLGSPSTGTKSYVQFQGRIDTDGNNAFATTQADGVLYDIEVTDNYDIEINLSSYDNSVLDGFYIIGSTTANNAAGLATYLGYNILFSHGRLVTVDENGDFVTANLTGGIANNDPIKVTVRQNGIRVYRNNVLIGSAFLKNRLASQTYCGFYLGTFNNKVGSIKITKYV